MPTIKFVKEKKEVEVPAGANLRKEARKAGVQLYLGIHKVLNCQGNGMCCSCRVHVTNGQENVSKPGFWERLNLKNIFNPFGFFARLNHEKEMRLSCQTKVHGDCEIETTPDFNWHGDKFWG